MVDCAQCSRVTRARWGPGSLSMLCGGTRRLSGTVPTGRPRLACEETATCISLDATDQAGATVVSAAVVNEALVARERDDVPHAARADNDDARDLICNHSGEELAFTCSDEAAASEERPTATGAHARRLGREYAPALVLVANDEDHCPACRSMRRHIRRDASAVDHLEPRCNPRWQPVLRGGWTLERPWRRRGSSEH